MMDLAENDIAEMTKASDDLASATSVSILDHKAERAKVGRGCGTKRHAQLPPHAILPQIKRSTTPAGLEPTRDKPNRFLVDRLNRSATVSFLRGLSTLHNRIFYVEKTKSSLS